MAHSQQATHVLPSQMKHPLKLSSEQAANHQSIRGLGVSLDVRNSYEYRVGGAANGSFDADLTPTLTTPSITTPIQFLQNWLPGLVHIITQARRIDRLIGMSTVGNWHDAEIIQQVLELTGQPSLYGDYAAVPLSSWNTNQEIRSVVRFEEGLQVGKLEEARAGAMDLSSVANKRAAVAEALEILRNSIGFFGFNDGDGRTYGLLNDPELPAYINVPVGATAGTEWSTKTPLEQQDDILAAATALRVNSGDNVDPGNTPIVLAVSTDARDSMSRGTEFNISTMDWLAKTYPNIRVESVPEFIGADGGESVFYMFAENVGDASTDDGKTFAQLVQTKMTSLGSMQKIKTFVEDFTGAYAGVLLKRPYAVYRASGI
jgi:hypothetical protein